MRSPWPDVALCPPHFTEVGTGRLHSSHGPMVSARPALDPLSVPSTSLARTPCPSAGESPDIYSSHSRQQEVPGWCARQGSGLVLQPWLLVSHGCRALSRTAEEGEAWPTKAEGWHLLLLHRGWGVTGWGSAPVLCVPSITRPRRVHTCAHTPADSKPPPGAEQLQVSKAGLEGAPSAFRRLPGKT